MTDPVATLRIYSDATASEDGRAALAELERRARIEARRDAFDEGMGLYLYAYHTHEDGTFGVCIYTHKLRIVGECADAPDKWTALEEALNAAGAL